MLPLMGTVYMRAEVAADIMTRLVRYVGPVVRRVSWFRMDFVYAVVLRM